MELNAEQIIKALECCSSSDGVSACESGCPYWGGDYDTCPCIEEPNFIIKNALSLLNELTEENERLKDDRDRYKRYYFNHDYDRMEADIKADTVREMQERLDKHFCHDPAFLGVEQRLIMDVIDQIAKEMLEGEK